MKTIKTNLILTISFLLVNSIIFAQCTEQKDKPQGPPPIPDAKQIEKIVNDLENEISLTDKQKVNVLKLYTEHFKEVIEKISDNTKPQRKEMEELRNNFEKEIKSILTKEQINKYEAYLKKQMPKHKRM